MSCISGVTSVFFFFFSSRRRHTRCLSDWSSDVCSSDLAHENLGVLYARMASDAYAKALQLDGSRQAIQPKLALITQIFPKQGGAQVKTAQATATATAASTKVADAKAAQAREADAKLAETRAAEAKAAEAKAREL